MSNIDYDKWESAKLRFDTRDKNNKLTYALKCKDLDLFLINHNYDNCFDIIIKDYWFSLDKTKSYGSNNQFNFELFFYEKISQDLNLVFDVFLESKCVDNKEKKVLFNYDKLNIISDQSYFYHFNTMVKTRWVKSNIVLNEINYSNFNVLQSVVNNDLFLIPKSKEYFDLIYKNNLYENLKIENLPNAGVYDQLKNSKEFLNNINLY